MKLFEDKLRDEYRIASTSENTYKYFYNNQQPKIVKIRDLLNKWFKNYPEEYKIELQQNFKNKFYNAFYELFIHETFFQQGFTLEPHPMLENSEKKPDFLAKRGKEEYYIEATTVSFLSDLEIKRDKFKDKFVEELNKMNAPNFWLGIEELKFKKNNFPKVKTLRKKIEEVLNKIDIRDFETGEKKAFLDNHIKFEDDNLLIILSVFIKSNSASRNKDFRPIGFESFPVTIKNANEDPDRIFKKFKQKANRYGRLDKPFIICLNVDLQFNLKYDVDWAFYSQKCFYSTTPKFTRVSAAIVSHVSVGNIFNKPKHRFIINPHSLFPIQMFNIELSFEYQEKITEKKDFNEILNLNKG